MAMPTDYRALAYEFTEEVSWKSLFSPDPLRSTMTSVMESTQDAPNSLETGSPPDAEGSSEMYQIPGYQNSLEAESIKGTQSSQKDENSPEYQASAEIRKTAEAAYQDLADSMNSCAYSMPFKFDLLPDSHPLPSGLNVMMEPHAMILTKETLRKAFTIAAEKFFEKVANISDAQNQKDIMNASAIILLQAPEHLTAANARKRVIMAWEKVYAEKGRLAILRDLGMLSGMLMSALNKHTKSPTLWAQRRWLIQRTSPTDPLNQLTPSPLVKASEISMVALTAAHNHPCNYYAWDYMRWWIENNPELLAKGGEDSGRSNVPASGLVALVKVIQQWCLQHPSDTSGWSFLLWLLTVPGTWSLGHLHLQGPFDETCEAILDRVSCLKLRNEALWIFLRTIMSAKAIGAGLPETFVTEAQRIYESDAERPRSRQITRAAAEWYKVHSKRG